MIQRIFPLFNGAAACSKACLNGNEKPRNQLFRGLYCSIDKLINLLKDQLHGLGSFGGGYVNEIDAFSEFRHINLGG